MTDKLQDLIRYSATGINLKATGATVLFITDTGRRFHPLFVVFEVTAAVGLITGATVSVGVTSAAFADIIPATVIGTTANKMLPNAASALMDSIPGGTDVEVNVSVAATGTSGSFSVSVVGYYE